MTTTDKAVDLVPCACGGIGEALIGWLNADYVACGTCGARTDEYEMHTGEEETAWNRGDCICEQKPEINNE